MHAMLIRDADKTDIFYVLTSEAKKDAWGSADLSNDIISDEIFREFLEDRTINYQNIKMSADLLVAHFAYVYDLNFAPTLKIIKENNYLDKIYNRFEFKNKETQEKIKIVYETAKQYLTEKG